MAKKKNYSPEKAELTKESIEDVEVKSEPEKTEEAPKKKVKPITVQGYLSDKDIPDTIKSMLSVKFARKLLSRQEWEELIENELTRRVS